MKGDILDIAKRRGFFWPSFEIYGGSSGFYTYGPLGALLKLRIENFIRDYFVNNEKCLLIEAPVLTTKDPWVASGHIESFSDMTTECQKCGEAYRADHLIEEKTKKSCEGLSLSELQMLIVKNKISCPRCKGKLGSLYDYNLMFKTFIGPGKSKITGFLRPETAQTTYMPFKRLYEIGRRRMPLGIIQFGKVFRNEISPRQGLVRLREFSQAEVQFFVDSSEKNKHPGFNEVKDMAFSVLTKHSQDKDTGPKKMNISNLVKRGLVNQWIAYHLAKTVMLFGEVGINKKMLRLRQHRDDERSFYSSDTWDIEFISEKFGKIELVGIADRGDYDLKRHMELSKQEFRIDLNGKKIPHVIEVALGIDRLLFCVMESCLNEEKNRTFFTFPPSISPYQVAVFPLVKKDKLPEMAKNIYEGLIKDGFFVLYDEGFIGKLYYRQDEAGLPFAVTIDYETLKKHDVTIRYRDNQKQIRVKIKDLNKTLKKLITNQIKFEKAGKLIK